MTAGTGWLDPAWLRRAYARVKENHGCAGVDGVSLEAYEQALDDRLWELEEMVRSERYWAWPLRQVVVEKAPGSKETRTLGVPAVADRVLQTAAAAALEPVLEPEFEECSFAYRRGRSVRMAVERVHALFLEGYRWILDADIDSFFDSVETDVAMGAVIPLVRDERLVRLWLDYAVWDGTRLRRPGRGLPQGCVISPMISNLCLDKLDEAMEGAGLKMVRYADDYVVLARSRREAERAREISEEQLGRLRLRLKESKTRICRASDGFRFLGVIFLKDLLLQPFRTGPLRLKVVRAAPELPAGLPPEAEKRRLRRYRAW